MINTKIVAFNKLKHGFMIKIGKQLNEILVITFARDLNSLLKS